jgi:ornithine cyclodeaminase
MRVLGSAAVASLLDVEQCVQVVDDAMRALSRQEVLAPLRTVMPLAPPNAMGIMPGAMPAQGRFGIKVLALYPGNGALGLPSHAGVMLLFDAATGTPLAAMDSDTLTAVRTAAASAVATRALARAGSRVLALLGTGHQALWHLKALRTVMKVERLQLWSRTRQGVQRFIDQAGTLEGVDIAIADTAREAVSGADVLCTVSSSRAPILRGDWLAPGQHVNLVGASVASAREADDEVVRRSRFFVDARESAAVQAGEWLGALRAGVVDAAHLQGEIGAVLLGRIAGRQSDDDITVYKSLGHAAQDIAAAQAVYQQALRRPEFPDMDW